MTADHPTSESDDQHPTHGTPVPQTVHDDFTHTERTVAADALAFMVREGAFGAAEIAEEAVHQQFSDDQRRAANIIQSFTSKSWYPLRRKPDGRGVYVLLGTEEHAKQVYNGLTGDELTTGFTPDEPTAETASITVSWDYIETVEQTVSTLPVDYTTVYDAYPPRVEITGTAEELQTAWTTLVDATTGDIIEDNPAIHDALTG